MSKVWILTVRVADFNQHGEYFDAVFNEKPTEEQLLDMDFTEDDACELLEDGLCGLLDGPGSREYKLEAREPNLSYFKPEE